MLVPVMERSKGFTVEQHASAGQRLKEIEICLRELYLRLEYAYGKSHRATLLAERLVFGGIKSQLWSLRNALDNVASREMPRDNFVTNLYFGPESEPLLRATHVAPCPA